MKSCARLALLLCWSIALPAGGMDKIVIGGLDGLDPSHETEHYSILLALSGGGARGLAAIGVLKAFEEKGLDVVAVAGTSMGGIVGGIYAAGYSPDDLTSIVHNTTFSGLFTNTPPRKTMFLTQRQERGRHLLSVRFHGFMPVIPRALAAGQKLTSLLTTLTTKANYHCNSDFNRLPIPFKTISTDIVSGHQVVLDSGSLAEAMRATMAFPLAFTGLEKDGQVLMDGGMVTPIPVELVRQMGDSITFVVAVNTASPLLPKDDLITPVDIANQVTTIMTADKLANQLQLADFVITPPLDSFNSMDFKFKDTLIEIGYQAGQAAADSIISLLKQKHCATRYTIVQVEVDSLAHTFEDSIRFRLLGKTVNRSELISILKSLTVECGMFRLEAILTPIDSIESGVNEVLLSITTYPNFRMQDVQFAFAGNTIYDNSTLAEQFNLSDSLLTPKNLRVGLDRILNLYHADGYDLTDVTKVTIKPQQKKITVVLDEAIIERIDVEGNELTKDWFVRSLFPLKIDEPYSTSLASKGIANIYGSDLFDQVTVDLVSYRGGAIAKIRVSEKKYRQMRLGWHWNDEYQSEEFLELLDDNIGGMGLELLFHARYGRDRQRYFASLKADRIFSTYLTSRIRVYHHRLDRHLFAKDGSRAGEREENRTGAELRFGQQIFKLGTVTAGLILEKIEYKNPGDHVYEKLGLRILKFESLVETFNRVPFPETGKKHLFELRFAGKYLGGEVEFTKFFTSLEAYFPLGKRLNYHPKLSIGLSRSGLPPPEKFYLGGMYSFGGFRTDQLYGDKLFVLTNELRLKLPLRLYLTARLDMGEVYTATDQVKLRNLRHGASLFLALDSPLGPFEFGYGIADNNQDRFYLNLGYGF